jgi:hypothetical protein
MFDANNAAGPMMGGTSLFLVIAISRGPWAELTTWSPSSLGCEVTLRSVETSTARSKQIARRSATVSCPTSQQGKEALWACSPTQIFSSKDTQASQ